MTKTRSRAIVLTNGLLDHLDAKTAHGLIRGSDRFQIVGVIDPVHGGKDAGEVLDGQNRAIPVYHSLIDFNSLSSEKAEFAIIGVALSGGKLPDNWAQLLMSCIENGLSIVNGLHQPLADNANFRAAAEKYKVDLVDIRKPPDFDQLRFWTGEIYQVKTPIIAVLGMDCAVGKRTTSRMITELCQQNRIQAEMIYTGQTGWLQGNRYGFIFDATPNDFICGEIERAIVDCHREASPDLILIEGQSSLRNPSGPCGSEFILSGNAKTVILQHAPFRTYYDELEELGCQIPGIEDEIKLISALGAATAAVTLNGEGGSEAELIDYQQDLTRKLQIPVIRPLQEGLSNLLLVIKDCLNNKLINPE